MVSYRILIVASVLFCSTKVFSQESNLNNINSILKECKKVQNPEACTSEKLLVSINENINYPAFAKEHNIQGRVVLEYTVNEKGKISDYKIAKGIGGHCDNAVLSAIKKTEANLKFNPAKKEGKKISYTGYLPISFKLKDQQAENKLVYHHPISDKFYTIDLSQENSFSINDVEVNSKDIAKRNLDKLRLYKADSLENKYAWFTEDRCTKARFRACDSEKSILKKEQCASQQLLIYVFNYFKKVGKSDNKGLVVAKFQVNIDGSVSDFQILKSNGAYSDKSVLELIASTNSLSEKWTPATMNGIPYPSEYVLPVSIK